MATKKDAQWFVYMIQTTDGRLYTGITTDLARRFAEHSNSEKGAKFFKISKPAELVFSEPHPNRSEATRRECEIKGMSRMQKLQLINVVSAKRPYHHPR